MEDLIEKNGEVKDLYEEHNLHNAFQEGCSSCWVENLVLKSGRKCPALDCKGNGVNLIEATYCEACQRFAESINIGI